MFRKRTLFLLLIVIGGIGLLSVGPRLSSELRLLLLTPQILKYRGIIQEHAWSQGVDARLMCALIVQESGFDANAESKVGAQGLAQLMPGTARDLGVESPFDAGENIAGAARHLRRLYNAFPESSEVQRHQLVLASYNAGLGRIRDAQALVRHTETGDPSLWKPVRTALTQLTPKHAAMHSEVWEERRPPHGYFRGFHETLAYVERVMYYYQRIRFYETVLFFL